MYGGRYTEKQPSDLVTAEEVHANCVAGQMVDTTQSVHAQQRQASKSLLGTTKLAGLSCKRRNREGREPQSLYMADVGN